MKILKYLAITIGVLLLLLIAIPFAFQDKVKDFALKTANSFLKSDVYIEDVSLSLLSNFPNASVELKNFGVAGRDTFAHDTLVNGKRLLAVVDIKSIISGNYVVKAVELEDVDVKAKVLADGRANWEIMESDTTAAVEDTTKSSTPFALSLEKVALSNINVVYNDQKSQAMATVDGLNLGLKGNIASVDSLALANIDDLSLDIASVAYGDTSMSAKVDALKFAFSGELGDAIVKLKTKLGIDAVSFAMQHVPYLSKVKVDANLNVDADFAKNKYVLADNSISLNDVALKLDGMVSIPDTTCVDMDLNVSTPKIQFKDILSLIPALYMNDFASLKADGKVALAVSAKGRMQGDSLPAIAANFVVENGKVKYDALPSQVDNINVMLDVKKEEGSLDKLVVDISNFSLAMAGNPLQASFKLKTPMSDPDFEAGIKGKVDLGSIKNIVKIDGIAMDGLVNMDIAAKGRMSYVENNQYDKFNVDGNISAEKVDVKGKTIGFDVNVPVANLDFSQKCIDLSKLDVMLSPFPAKGGTPNDVSVTGKLENFLGFAFKKGVLAGNLNIKSKYINANDFLGESSETAPAEEASKPAEQNTQSAGSALVIPARIDFAMNLDMVKLIYTNIEVDKIVGRARVKDQKLDLSQLSANTMDGSVGMSASYDSKNPRKPLVKADMKVKNMSIPKVFSTVNTCKEFAPILADATGKFNMDINLTADMDDKMNVDLKSIVADGKFNALDLGVKGNKSFKDLAKTLNNPKLENPSFKDLKVKFQIRDGRLLTDPFDIKVAGSSMTVSGSSGLDQTLDYKAAYKMAENNGKSTNMNVLLKGTFSDPKIRLDASEIGNAIKDAVNEKVDEVKNKINEKAVAAAKKQAAKMMADAEKQSAKIKADAQKQGDKVVADAQTQADKIVAGSKNALDKKVKQKAADKIISESKKNREKIISDGDKRAADCIANAQKNGDKLIKNAEKSK